jgi:hypothetical protein
VSGFNVGTLNVPGVGSWSLEITNDEEFEKRMAEINATLRFKHKITDPKWETRKVGGGEPVKPSKPKQQRTPKDKQAEPSEQKPARPARPARPAAPPMRPAAPSTPTPPVEREGSIEGTIDLAAARRLARS